MVLRPFLYSPGSCASYLFGCTTHHQLAVVDPHLELVDQYVAVSEAIGSPITALFETHVQADHVSGSRALVARTGATAYFPAGADVEFVGRGLSGNPISSIGFERTHNTMLGIRDPDAFVAALLADMPPPPANRNEIVAANRSGRVPARA